MDVAASLMGVNAADQFIALSGDVNSAQAYFARRALDIIQQSDSDTVCQWSGREPRGDDGGENDVAADWISR